MIKEPIRQDDYSKRQPDIDGEGAQVWVTNLSNIRLCYAALTDCPGTDFDTYGGEGMMLLPDAGVIVQAGQETLRISEASVLVIGADVGQTSVSGSGRVVLISRNKPQDDTRDHNSSQGLKLFSLANATQDDSNFRVFRSAEFMLNVLKPRSVPRDESLLSPHMHTDFEQISFAIEGQYIHHLRWPWTKDMSQWREDSHVNVGSPSVLEIPRGVTHTSQNVDGPGWLIDVFHPLRPDFLATEGLVVNADDYKDAHTTSN